MKKSHKILITFFLLVGIGALYLGLNVNLKCADATARDNFIAGLPLTVLGAYCLITALFFWKKPEIGNILATFIFIIATIMALAVVLDLSFPIIKTSCVN